MAGYAPGAAYEARIYWDAGTGEIDFSEPHATVEMGNPTEPTRYTWQSAPLTDGVEYRRGGGNALKGCAGAGCAKTPKALALGVVR